MSNLDDYKKAAQELNDIDHQSDETRLAGEQYELLSDILCDVQTYSIRMVRQELRGDEISPSQAIRQILNWHETEKQKYAMAYANEIIGGNDDIKSMPYTGDSNNSLRNRQRELNKSKGGKI